eukprot:gene10928-12089_t
MATSLYVGRCGTRFVTQFNVQRLLLSRIATSQVYDRKNKFSTTTAAREKLFNKILIANRGEIACRIIKSCQKLGIKSVAVYSEADANAMHSHMADEAVLIGPPPSSQSYLRMDAVIKACKETGAEAVHPGYGFLSENTVFADQLESNGIAFIGPSAYALKAMGDKLESKRIALKAQVSTIPGYDGVVKDDDQAVAIARDIGYPVMIKASAGGGGKGMRIAYNDMEVREGFRFSSQEAKSSFGDDRLLLEKFIERPRHIEVQVIGDKHGNVVYLNERECSIQRRNQKVVEEAPSPFIDTKTRKAMGTQAVMLAKEVGYSSAGTVEFLVDKNRNFFFLEMNTRLQVEHPITELITGVDLVELMIRSAAGNIARFSLVIIFYNSATSSIKQCEMTGERAQLEARRRQAEWMGHRNLRIVRCTDPYKNFGLPSTGRLFQYIQPDQCSDLENIRCDTGIMEGSEISIHYDSMICKLSTYGKTRNDAIETMRKALDYYVIRGVMHNISLLRDIMDRPSFVAGNLSTNFLNEEYPEGFKGKILTFDEKNEVVAAACNQFVHRNIRAGEFLNQTRHTTKRKDLDEWDLVCTLDGERFEVGLKVIDHGIDSVINGVKVVFKSSSPKQSTLLVADVNDIPCVFQKFSRYPGQRLNIIHKGTKYQVVVHTRLQSELHQHMPVKQVEDLTPFLRSPMPGTIKDIRCKVGDNVYDGQEIVVIEAMKMQNSLRCLKSGRVKALHFRVGDSVAEDELIMEIE